MRSLSQYTILDNNALDFRVRFYEMVVTKIKTFNLGNLLIKYNDNNIYVHCASLTYISGRIE